MFKNSGPNSDSEQCTESKLGWVHQVHTLNPACSPRPTVSQPVAVRVAACGRSCRRLRRPCRSLWSVVSQACPALRVMSRALVCVARLLRRIVVPSRPCRSIVSRHSQLPSLLLSPYNRLYHDTPASQTACLSRYKDCIVTRPLATSPSPLTRYKIVYHDTIYQPGHACAASHVMASLGLSWPVPWPSRPYRGRPCTPLRAQACLPGPSCQANVTIQLAVL